MNSGPTGERVHDALKQRIQSGAFRPGDRLDPAELAETLASSTTPVREALCLLTGEGLVEARPGGGYHLPLIDPPALQDLYGWAQDLLLLAMRAAPADPTSPPDVAAPDYAAAVAGLFEAVGGRSANVEHARAIALANARLHRARLIEAQQFDLLDEEFAGLRRCLESGDRGAARAAVVRYTRRRVRAAADIVRALYRD